MSDVTFQVTWDAQAEAMLQRLMTTGQSMQYLFDDLSYEYGKAGTAFIKDAVRGNGYWQASSGETAAGIDYEVDHYLDGFTIHFIGTHMTADGRHNVAHMLDVGNFDENTELWASGLGNSLGFRAFPISARAGDVWTFLSVIHGAGHTSSEYPRFFSDNAVYELRDRTPQLAESPLQSFLDSLV